MFASLWIIPVFALIVAFLMYGVMTVLFLFGAPHYVLLPAIAISVAIYGLLEGIARVLKKIELFNFWNYLAICAVISFAFGFLPFPLLDWPGRSPFEILLEEYAAALMIYSTSFYVMAAIWWFSYKPRRAGE